MLGHKDVDGERFYLAKWRNLDEKHNSYISEYNSVTVYIYYIIKQIKEFIIKSCAEAIREYEHMLTVRETVEICAGYAGYSQNHQAVEKAADAIKIRDPKFNPKIQLPYLNKELIDQPEIILNNNPPALVKSEVYKTKQNQRKNRLAKLRNKKKKENKTNENENQ